MKVPSQMITWTGSKTSNQGQTKAETQTEGEKEIKPLMAILETKPPARFRAYGGPILIFLGNEISTLFQYPDISNYGSLISIELDKRLFDTR